MDEKQMFQAIVSLKPYQRKQLGIYALQGLVDVLRESGRKISQRTIQRMVHEEQDFPVIREGDHSERRRLFFRLADVEAFLDRDVHALLEHFGENMVKEPLDIGTPYVTREDMQDSINELYVRVDHLQRTVDKNNEKVADMEKALALFVQLISDKLGIEKGEKNG